MVCDEIRTYVPSDILYDRRIRTIDTILYSISNDIEFEKAVFGVGKLVIVSFSISFA